jgi:hypothetical protein
MDDAASVNLPERAWPAPRLRCGTVLPGAVGGANNRMGRGSETSPIRLRKDRLLVWRHLSLDEHRRTR